MSNRYIRTGSYVKCKVCKNQIYVEPYLLKSGRKKYCSKECLYKSGAQTKLFEKGHKDLVPKEKRGHSLETRKKMIIANRKVAKRGADSVHWKGGKSSERHKAMGKWEYKEWRNNVFTRDKYTCRECGTAGGYLHADHIKTWSKYPELRYDLDNGRTLCTSCHYEITFNKKLPEGLIWGVQSKKAKVG